LRVRSRRVNVDAARIFGDGSGVGVARSVTASNGFSRVTDAISFVVASSETLAGDGGIANLTLALPLSSSGVLVARSLGLWAALAISRTLERNSGPGNEGGAWAVGDDRASSFEVATMTVGSVFSVFARTAFDPSTSSDLNGLDIGSGTRSRNVTDFLGRRTESFISRSSNRKATRGTLEISSVSTRTMETVLIVSLTCLPGIARDFEFQEFVGTTWRNMANVGLALGVGYAGVSNVGFGGSIFRDTSSLCSLTGGETLGTRSGSITTLTVEKNVITSVATRTMSVFGRESIGRTSLFVT
jgi:hypothetical protein